MCELSGISVLPLKTLSGPAGISLVSLFGTGARQASQDAESKLLHPLCIGADVAVPSAERQSCLERRFPAQWQPNAGLEWSVFQCLMSETERRLGDQGQAPAQRRASLFPGPLCSFNRLHIPPDLPVCFILIVHDLNLIVCNRQLLMSPPNTHGFSSFVTKKPQQGTF